jgi:hypothetical protein
MARDQVDRHDAQKAHQVEHSRRGPSSAGGGDSGVCVVE